MRRALAVCVESHIETCAIEKELHYIDVAVERGEVQTSIIIVFASSRKVGTLIEQELEHRHASVTAGDVDGPPSERIARLVDEINLASINELPYPLDTISLNCLQKNLIGCERCVASTSVDQFLELAPHKLGRTIDNRRQLRCRRALDERRGGRDGRGEEVRIAHCLVDALSTSSVSAADNSDGAIIICSRRIAPTRGVLTNGRAAGIKSACAAATRNIL
mmetsp:Transcript_37041/g.63953  ORF Transcript_37041/g.63953 Transcript_37041/m.63953 type:complete len:220 (-) Transcript_37041:205-864(-)